jgi:hypothetical protein
MMPSQRLSRTYVGASDSSLGNLTPEEFAAKAGRGEHDRQARSARQPMLAVTRRTQLPRFQNLTVFRPPSGTFERWPKTCDEMNQNSVDTKLGMGVRREKTLVHSG